MSPEDLAPIAKALDELERLGMGGIDRMRAIAIDDCNGCEYHRRSVAAAALCLARRPGDDLALELARTLAGEGPCTCRCEACGKLKTFAVDACQQPMPEPVMPDPVSPIELGPSKPPPIRPRPPC